MSLKGIHLYKKPKSASLRRIFLKGYNDDRWFDNEYVEVDPSASANLHAWMAAFIFCDDGRRFFVDNQKMRFGELEGAQYIQVDDGFYRVSRTDSLKLLSD